MACIVNLMGAFIYILTFMDLEQIDKEFELLKEYMNIYIQILPECVSCGGKILK